MMILLAQLRFDEYTQSKLQVLMLQTLMISKIRQRFQIIQCPYSFDFAPFLNNSGSCIRNRGNTYGETSSNPNNQRSDTTSRDGRFGWDFFISAMEPMSVAKPK